MSKWSRGLVRGRDNSEYTPQLFSDTGKIIMEKLGLFQKTEKSIVNQMAGKAFLSSEGSFLQCVPFSSTLSMFTVERMVWNSPHHFPAPIESWPMRTDGHSAVQWRGSLGVIHDLLPARSWGSSFLLTQDGSSISLWCSEIVLCLNAVSHLSQEHCSHWVFFYVSLFPQGSRLLAIP